MFTLNQRKVQADRIEKAGETIKTLLKFIEIGGPNSKLYKQSIDAALVFAAQCVAAMQEDQKLQD